MKEIHVQSFILEAFKTGNKYKSKLHIKGAPTL